MAFRADSYADSGTYGSPPGWRCPSCDRPAVEDPRFPGSGLLLAAHSDECPASRDSAQAKDTRRRAKHGETA